MSLMPPLQYPTPDTKPGFNKWAPKFPDIAVSPQTGSNPQQSNSGAAWELAPATSHVYGWKLQAGGFYSKFYAPSVAAPGGTTAILSVGFKPNGATSGLDKEYEYYFPTEAAARVWLEQLRMAAHPGYVVQGLIAARIPYKRVSG